MTAQAICKFKNCLKFSIRIPEIANNCEYVFEEASAEVLFQMNILILSQHIVVEYQNIEKIGGKINLQFSNKLSL